MLAGVCEAQVGADHEVFDGPRYKHLAATGPRGNPVSDGHRDSAYVVVEDLALACVNTSAHVDPEGLQRVDDRLGLAHRTSGSVEGGEQAVAG